MSTAYKWLAGIASAVILVVWLLSYLLQPSGQISDFKIWQAQQKTHPHHKRKLTVQFFGVSTLLFDDGQDQILIDGFFSRPSLAQVVFQKIHSNPALVQQIIQQQHLQRTRAVLVTHSHYDHALDVATLADQLPHAKIIGSSSTLNIARGGQVSEQQLSTVEPWKARHFGRFSITAIPSQHTPPTSVNNDLGQEIIQPLKQPARFSDFKEGHSFDYLIEHSGQRILVKASTGTVPNQFKNLQVDVLFLGIAQLSKQSAEFQQQYLAQTLGALKPKTVVPIHWDNFFKPLNEPLQFLPHLADNTTKSLQILIEATNEQSSQMVLLSQPVSYHLQ